MLFAAQNTNVFWVSAYSSAAGGGEVAERWPGSLLPSQYLPLTSFPVEIFLLPCSHHSLFIIHHPFSLLIPSLNSDKPIIFINTWKCYFAVKPIHAIALICCQIVIIRIRFQKVWISAGLPTLSLEAYKLIIIKNCVQMLEEKFYTILVSAPPEY